jgi:hypothetical protein
MNSFNFNSDEFKKQVLESEGLKPSDSGDYEVLEPVDAEVAQTEEIDPHKEFQDLISKAPMIPGTSKGVKNIIRDASALAKAGNQEKADSINTSLCQIITDYNKKYGTSLDIDFSDISRTLVNVSDPRKTRVLELYLSNVFQSIRPVIYLQMLSKLALLVDYVLDPQRLTDGSLTYSDQFICIEKILGYINLIEGLKDEILIKGADLELQKIGEEEQEEMKSGMSDDDKEMVDEFMKLFKKDKGLK